MKTCFALETLPKLGRVLSHVNFAPLETLETQGRELVSLVFPSDPRGPRMSQITLTTSPLNTEPPPSSLISSLITPTALVFNRNHGPFLNFSSSPFALSLSADPSLPFPPPTTLSLATIRESYAPSEVVAILQCAGNRRAEMAEKKEVEGLLWDRGAVANVKWTGTPHLCAPVTLGKSTHAGAGTKVRAFGTSSASGASISRTSTPTGCTAISSRRRGVKRMGTMGAQYPLASSCEFVFLSDRGGGAHDHEALRKGPDDADFASLRNERGATVREPWCTTPGSHPGSHWREVGQVATDHLDPAVRGSFNAGVPSSRPSCAGS